VNSDTLILIESVWQALLVYLIESSFENSFGGENRKKCVEWNAREGWV